MQIHEPVLLKDFISLASPITGCWVDGTFGAGGYSRALLQNGARQVLAIDKDSTTKVFLKIIQNEYGDMIKFYNQSFADMEKNNDIAKRDDIEGVVLDLGNQEVLKCLVPGQPNLVDHISYDTLYKHFYKAYGNMLDQFIK